MNTEKDYKAAVEFATKAHAGQKRSNGDAYITHPLRVADSLDTWEEKITAVLHDVVEDTDVTEEELRKEEFVTIDIQIAVAMLTKKDFMSYCDYIRYLLECDNIITNLARKIKIADLKDNLRDHPLGARRDKYELSLLLLTHITLKKGV